MLNILNTQCSRDNMLVLYGDDDIIINTNYLKDVSPLSNIQTVFQSHVMLMQTWNAFIIHSCKTFCSTFFPTTTLFYTFFVKILVLGCVKHITILALIVFTYIYNYNLAFEEYTVLLHLHLVASNFGVLFLAPKHLQHYLYMKICLQVFFRS